MTNLSKIEIVKNVLAISPKNEIFEKCIDKFIKKLKISESVLSAHEFKGCAVDFFS